jgi:hypothetical protein
MSSPALSLRAARSRAPRPIPLGGLGAIALGSLALALVSLLLPSTPTYDPYAWLLWGREILHLDLDTEFGPSWKPLPAIFTTVFAIVPDAAPDLWVAVARAGALASIALAFRVTRRAGGGVAGGLVAAACLAVSTDYLRFAAIGDSEGLLVALVLAAVDLHLSGHRKAALWVAFAACLLRPEAWPWTGLYALWLIKQDRSTIKTVAGMCVAGIVLWFGPELWGSGNALRAGERARDPNPNAIAFADFPALEALKRMLSMTPLPAKLGFAALAVAWAAGWWRDRRIGILALMAIGWMAVVAVMTEGGFSGNARYMIAPVALTCVAGGAGWAWAFGRIPRVGAVLAVVVAAALLVSPASHLDDDARAVRSEARLNDALSGAIAAAGGPDAVLGCGTVTTGPFQVTALAWKLDAPIRRIDLVPTTPGTVFRSFPGEREIPGAPVIVVSGDPRWQEAAHVDPWQVLQACRGSRGT